MNRSLATPSAFAAACRTPYPGTMVGEPAFNISQADFDRVRRLIHQHAGIHLQDGKQAMVYSRLARRLRQTGHARFADYLHALTLLSQDHPEWQAFVNCLTTNLTSFFREEHHFSALAQDLQARAARPLRLWCCAASTGEEPYSLAMVINEVLGPSARVKLIASDIDTQVLATAQRAIYPIDSKGLSAERQQRYFLRGTGANAGLMRVRPELTRLVEFQSFNLVSRSWARLGEAFDLVFCRNVMIYFDAPTQRQVLQDIHAHMRPGGLLYVGHSENFSNASDLFRLRGKTVYERA